MHSQIGYPYWFYHMKNVQEHNLSRMPMFVRRRQNSKMEPCFGKIPPGEELK